MPKPTPRPKHPSAALSVEEVMSRTGLGRTTLYRVIRAGGIVARKSGRRTVFLESDVARYLANLPRLVPKQGA